jgi:hypothetical protein
MHELRKVHTDPWVYPPRGTTVPRIAMLKPVEARSEAPVAYHRNSFLLFSLLAFAGLSTVVWIAVFLWAAMMGVMALFTN